jgi:hypothetical protein
MGVVRLINAKHEKQPITLAKTRKPRLKPSLYTAKLNIPRLNKGSLTPKKIAMKIKVMNPKIKGIERNLK